MFGICKVRRTTLRRKATSAIPPPGSPSRQYFAVLLCLLIAFGCNRISDRPSSGAEATTSATNQAIPKPTDSPQLELLPTSKQRTYDATIRDIIVREDPEVDGWQTEKFNELADKQLKQLGKLLSDASLIDKQHALALATSDFRGAIRPQHLNVAFEDGAFQVMRPSAKQSPQKSGAASSESRGLDVFLAATRAQANALGHGKRRFKFKTIRVNLSPGAAATRSYFQLHSLGDDSVQVNSTWDCEWRMEGRAPKLASVSVTNYEEIRRQQGESVTGHFADMTRSLFAGNDSLDEQFVFGRDHWYANLEGSIGVEGRGNGIAIGDANGDGLDDVYICQPAALPNRLFIREVDGSMRDTSSEAGVDWLDSSRGALFVDMDNDGDQDLVLTQSSRVLVHENDGSGKFELKASIPTISRLFSINAIDYDQDSDLDLYVCGYSGVQQIRPEDIFASPVPYHDANNGAPNLLLHNDGDWQFRDVTKQVGLDENNLRFSLASFWDDFDNDGDLDVYVANDFGRNNLYRNDLTAGGRFVDIAGAVGVEDIGPGMSASSGDVDNDGRPDIYVSNMFSSAGSRITQMSQFKPEANETDLAGFKRHARGNSLFRNVLGGAGQGSKGSKNWPMGELNFADKSVESGTTMGRWAWGSLLVDINNDGWRDAYVTNGFVTADNNNDL